MDIKEMKSEIKRLCSELGCNEPAGLDGMSESDIELIFADLVLKKMYFKFLQRKKLEQITIQ